MSNGNLKVFVGMSGGVDSSVTAALLVEQGYDVTGVYMKNWSKDLPGFPCPWMEDYQDAKRVAVQLGIPFEMFDFETEYFERVVQYMLDGFKSGITPNPDVMCNQEIKFKLFYDLAREKGADYIATGHYARVSHETEHTSLQTSSSSGTQPEPKSSQPVAKLLAAADANKDQTYFLYRISEDALVHTLFPLGDMTKDEVRAEAQKRGLATAKKKESMGICFVGKVGIKDFLTQHLTQNIQARPVYGGEGVEELGQAEKADAMEYVRPGLIVDQNGITLGEHDGAIFYTIGQRHGLDVGGGMPLYVTGKNMDTNTVYVTSDIADDQLWSEKIDLSECHWINSPPRQRQTLAVRTRHRAPLVKCEVTAIEGRKLTVQLEESLRALTPGQSAVFYDDDVCIGGGIIT